MITTYKEKVEYKLYTKVDITVGMICDLYDSTQFLKKPLNKTCDARSLSFYDVHLDAFTYLKNRHSDEILYRMGELDWVYSKAAISKLQKKIKKEGFLYFRPFFFGPVVRINPKWIGYKKIETHTKISVSFTDCGNI